MPLSAIRLVALALAASALPAGWWLLSRPLGGAIGSPARVMPVQALDSVALTAVDSVSDLAVAAAPFRATRRAAGQRFDARGMHAPAVRVTARPAIAVTGILWGAEPAAVLEGLPGVDGGRLVRAGERVGGIHVRRITRNKVVATGYDTTWVLAVREVWR